VSRPSPIPVASNSRERLKQEHRQAEPLAQAYPQLAQVKVEFDFDDGSALPPSQQSFSYFPAARSLFRYPCPCHACNGEFDLGEYVAELAGRAGRMAQERHMTVVCPGQRVHALHERKSCPIRAGIRISATWRPPE
jgi:hypothetical protein